MWGHKCKKTNMEEKKLTEKEGTREGSHCCHTSIL